MNAKSSFEWLTGKRHRRHLSRSLFELEVKWSRGNLQYTDNFTENLLIIWHMRSWCVPGPFSHVGTSSRAVWSNHVYHTRAESCMWLHMSGLYSKPPCLGVLTGLYTTSPIYYVDCIALTTARAIITILPLPQCNTIQTILYT